MQSKINSHGCRIGTSYKAPFSKSVITQPLRMTAQDIAFWQRAIDSARNTTFPRRKFLYDLYENIRFDGHLLSVCEKRKLAVTNKKINFITTDGTENESIQNNILQTPWFYDYTDISMDSVAFGHALCELIIKKGVIAEAEKINHHNVSPERGFLFPQYSDEYSGFYFRGEHEDIELSKTLIEIGKSHNYGLYFPAAQYVIYKRGGFGDWAQFAELFGMPFRSAEYDPFDEESRKLLSTALENMGGAGHIVIPRGSSIKFHEAAKPNSADLFNLLIDTCNKEISKIFLGQTMTTENGSSRSQSEVHKEVEEEININDLMRMEYLHNFVFKKKVAELGCPEIMTGKLVYENTVSIPLERQIEIDIKVAEKVEIDPQYWYEKYGVPKPDKIKTGKVRADSNQPNAGAYRNKPENNDSNQPKEKINLSKYDQFLDMHTKITELYKA